MDLVTIILMLMRKQENYQYITMKKIITLILAMSAFMPSAKAQITETAADAVRNMGLGWNLGNTLDAYSCTTTDVTKDSYWGGQGLESETCWGQPSTTRDLITMMKNAGFGTVRVPVTWFNHMDKDGNVNAAWMARVKEVVDYVVGNGMYCILNVHHDTGADSDSFYSWLKADETIYANNKARYEHLWQQIASVFKDYDEHLVFEAYNEMLDTKNSWCYASFNTSGQYNSAIATSAYNAINKYGQSFVDAVRATGGNNASRNLIVNTYCAANGYGTWSSHLKEPVTMKTLPDDTSTGHIIFEVHDYPNILSNNKERSMSDIKNEVDGTISILNTYLVSKGAPVIIGEWGTANVDSGSGGTDYDLHRDLMFQFAEYFVKQCKANNIGTVYWMGLSDGLYRSYPAFNQADLAECISKAYHGSTAGYEFPTAGNTSSVVAFEGEKTIYGYNGNVSINSDAIKMVGEPLTLSVTYKLTATNRWGYNIQLLDGGWTKTSFIVDGKTYSGDCDPSSVYGSEVGVEHTVNITFSDAVYSNISTKGIIIQGDGITITKVVLSAGSTGITPVVADDARDADAAVYNMAGQRMASPRHGLYIKGGKVYLAK